MRRLLLLVFLTACHTAPESDGEPCYQACRFEHNGIAFQCEDGKVSRQDLYVVSYCHCGTEQVAYSEGPSEPDAVHTCEFGCDPTNSYHEVDEDSETPADMNRVCRTTDTCSAPEPTPPEACLGRTVEACGSYVVYDYLCAGGQVTRQETEVVVYCGCGEAMGSCNGEIASGEPLLLETCDLGCAVEGFGFRSPSADNDANQFCSPAP